MDLKRITDGNSYPQIFETVLTDSELLEAQRDSASLARVSIAAGREAGATAGVLVDDLVRMDRTQQGEFTTMEASTFYQGLQLGRQIFQVSKWTNTEIQLDIANEGVTA